MIIAGKGRRLLGDDKLTGQRKVLGSMTSSFGVAPPVGAQVSQLSVITGHGI